MKCVRRWVGEGTELLLVLEHLRRPRVKLSNSEKLF